MTRGLDDARLAVLVHEVRSPVAALSAVGEAVAESEWDPTSGQELVRLAVAACQAIERIVMDVAVASVRVEAVDVRAVAREAGTAYAVRGIDIALDVGGGVIQVDGDAVRLRQVLDNLLANAVGHGGASGVVVQVSADDDAVRLTVTDAGPGIPADDLSRIFELGVRLDEVTSGTGLGLALARTLAEAHGGELTVVSEVGVGTTFTLVLPAGRAQPDTRASSS